MSTNGHETVVGLPGAAASVQIEHAEAPVPTAPTQPSPLSHKPRGKTPGGTTPRWLGDLGDPTTGPTLLCIGGLHGNEPAGVLGLERAFARLADMDIAGRVVGLAGNLQALDQHLRFVDEDLNRMWTRERVETSRDQDAHSVAEEVELVQLADAIHAVVAQATDRIYCLDIHTTSGPGPAFTVVDDSLPNRRFGQALGVPLVLGLEEAISGTLDAYLESLGVVSIGFEAGQHEESSAVEAAEDAVWIALEVAGVVSEDLAPVREARQRLRSASRSLPRFVEVVYRHEISASSEFGLHPGLVSFQHLPKGHEVGIDAAGPVRTPRDGILLMPLYQAQGDDGYFLTQRVRPSWMAISAFLRHLRLERFLSWLPGVQRHPTLERAFLVDTRTARWLALELFHLLGFRRADATESQLTLVRRGSGL